MSDQFDFPQASKRRKISTYGNNRSTLTSSPSQSPAIEQSEALTRSSRSQKLRKVSATDTANISKDEVSAVSPANDLPKAQNKLSSEANDDEAIPEVGVEQQKNEHEELEVGLASRYTNSRRSSQRTSRNNASSVAVDKEAMQENLAARVSTPPSVVSDQEYTNEANDAVVKPRSSGRERKRPRRFSNSPQKSKSRAVETAQAHRGQQEKDAENESPSKTAPKGILTPSRRGKRATRKSVVFDQEDKDIEKLFGFKDIDGSVQSNKKSLAQKVKSSTGGRKGASSNVTRPLEKEIVQAKGITDDEVDDDSIGRLISNQDFGNEARSDEVVAPAWPVNDEDPSLLAIKAMVLSRLTHFSASTDPSAIPSRLQSQYTTLHNLLTATITAGESNSLLLLGNRGSGKSHLLKHALSDLATKHESDFHTVWLNGFIQTDDRVALREIWRQLGREINVEDGEADGVNGSYADTMASLLSLLSHPEEFELDHEAADSGDQETPNASKSVVFILDEFDLFTTHPRQTLLYNLFDIAQSRKAPIAVIGCSTRMDVVDCLEKRVKSRFSHRWVHVPSSKSIDGFEEVIKNLLMVEEDPALLEEEVVVRQNWNEHIQKSFFTSSRIQSIMKRIFYTSKSLPDLCTALYIPVATAHLSQNHSPEAPVLERPATTSTISVQPSLLTILPGIPTLHLFLLVAAARLDAIHNLTATNFNLVYNHYVELIARAKLQQTASGALAVSAGLRQWSRETAKGAWEDLSGWNLIVPVTAGVGGKDEGGESVGGEGASVRMCRVDVTLDDLTWVLRGIGGGTADILGKWCREA